MWSKALSLGAAILPGLGTLAVSRAWAESAVDCQTIASAPLELRGRRVAHPGSEAGWLLRSEVGILGLMQARSIWPRRGVSLLEVLVALTVLTVLSVSLVSTMMTGRAAHYRAENHELARCLVLEGVEWLKTLSFKDVSRASSAPGQLVAGLLPVAPQGAPLDPRPEWAISPLRLPGSTMGRYLALVEKDAFPAFYRHVVLDARTAPVGSERHPWRALHATIRVFWWELEREGEDDALRTLEVETLVLDRESLP